MTDRYVPVLPQIDVSVDKIYTVHYFEYAKDYFYPGERHNFWEFCYVDKGQIFVLAGERQFALNQSEIVFHKPGEWHGLEANRDVAPNLVVVSFDAAGPLMPWFEGKTLTVTNAERQELARIIQEAGGAFATPLNDPGTKQLARSAAAPPGAEQMIKNCLELLLIQLYRRGQTPDDGRQKPTSLVKEKHLDESVGRVVQYLRQNIDKKLTLEQICRANLVGRSYLQKKFRDKTGGGVIEYFGRMKIEQAKRMIREGRGNFTEIASALGYNSIHYFSRHFKKVTGMTPSEYASSVKVITERSRLD